MLTIVYLYYSGHIYSKKIEWLFCFTPLMKPVHRNSLKSTEGPFPRYHMNQFSWIPHNVSNFLPLLAAILPALSK